jgi:hypothetical protein
MLVYLSGMLFGFDREPGLGFGRIDAIISLGGSEPGQRRRPWVTVVF